MVYCTAVTLHSLILRVANSHGIGNTSGHKITSDKDIRTSNKPSPAAGPPRLGTFEHPDFLATVYSKESTTRQWHASVKFKRHVVNVFENVRQK